MARPMKRMSSIAAAGLLLALAATLVIVPRVAAASCFPDVEGHWAETFICWLKSEGIVSGYGDGTYRPDNSVTRGEMAVYIQRVAGAGSAGPVANADLLDGIDSSGLASDAHDHMITQASVNIFTVTTTSYSTVLSVSLDLPDRCAGSIPVDHWNVGLIASGFSISTSPLSVNE